MLPQWIYQWIWPGLAYVAAATCFLLSAYVIWDAAAPRIEPEAREDEVPF
jgi:hypothetical protein